MNVKGLFLFVKMLFKLQTSTNLFRTDFVNFGKTNGCTYRGQVFTSIFLGEGDSLGRWGPVVTPT